MRQGQNALDVIERVKTRIKEIEPGLPKGVKVVPIYDRSDLIKRSIDTTRSTLIEIIVTVMLVIILFLWHPPSAIIPIVTIPVAVLISFVPFKALGITANIMSLGGIAIAVGVLVDAAIVVVEQTHKRLEEWQKSDKREEYQAVIVGAIKQVAGPSFFALLVIAVSFLPVLTLEGEMGRLFKPLAYTKTLAIIVAALLAITLDPALRVFVTHMRYFNFKPLWLCKATNAILSGKIQSEEKHPISRLLIRIYEPVAEWTLRRKWVVISFAIVLILITVPIYGKLGSELMPPLDEGSLLYMPTTMPGISIAEAQRILQVTDRIISRFPEVEKVLGKAGRAETATDPAPLSMIETLVILKPESEWRRKDTWYSSWAPDWLKSVLRHISPDHISTQELVNEMNDALQVPGVSNSWTMPIKGRIDMLTTGLRTPIGLKISGADLNIIEQVGTQVESVLTKVKGTRSVFAERTGGGYFIDFEWNRSELARYGLTIDEVQTVVQNAIGGDNVTTTIQGRERYPVNVRYMRDFRGDFSALSRVLVPAAGGQRHIPLAQLATIKEVSGPSMIRDEDGMLTGYVYLDIADRDPQSYIDEAGKLIREKVELPAGYAITWSGNYEAMERLKDRLKVIIPVTLLLILFLLYLNTRSLTKTMIILLAVPFSAVGAIWFLYLMGYHMSTATWVGLIALLGVDAETGVFMLLYLDLAYNQAKKENRLNNSKELRQAVINGAVKRVRPKFMTVATMFLGLVPIMWASGTGSDVMKRIAAPMIGGIFTSFFLELLIYPAIYEFWKRKVDLKKKIS
jgi:Cu(I)/Ag(I) efflux system membrane protein CusA/SilA